MRNKKTSETIVKIREFIDINEEYCTIKLSYGEALSIYYYIKLLESLVDCYDNVLSKRGDTNER